MVLVHSVMFFILSDEKPIFKKFKIHLVNSILEEIIRLLPWIFSQMKSEATLDQQMKNDKHFKTI